MKKVLKILLIMIIAIALLWKIPFYVKLKSVKIPAGCEEVKTKVILSDVYWYHIIGERVIKYDGGIDGFKDYVSQNNSENAMKSLSIYPFVRDWDDFAVHPPLSYYDLEKSEQEKYIVIGYYYQLEQ